MTRLRSVASPARSRTSTHGLDWRARALCGPDTAEWFVVARASLTEANLAALDMCKRCPVRRECAEDILAADPELRVNLLAAGMLFGKHGLQVPVKVPSVWTLQDRARRRRRIEEEA